MNGTLGRAATAGIVLAAAWAAAAQERGAADRAAAGIVKIVGVSESGIEGSGSGWVADGSGLIVTNRHVVEGADFFLVYMLDDPGEEPELRYTARTAWYSGELDVAVLVLMTDADGRPLDAEELSLPGPREAERTPRRGDRLYIAGYPAVAQGHFSVTEGIVSAVRNETVDGARTPAVIMTDAEIAPGNSGGPALNEHWEVVGTATSVRLDGESARLAEVITVEAIRAAVPGMIRGAPARRISGRAHSRRGRTRPGAPALDHRGEPYFGRIRLGSGFEPEVRWEFVLGGGYVDASVLGGSCTGGAGSRPDLKLEWLGGRGTLSILFTADDDEDDATLIVRTPGGRWLCNDDARAGIRDPLVTVDTPERGEYSIWVGAYDEDSMINGSIGFTQIDLRLTR